jgi:hypothetical protein
MRSWHVLSAVAAAVTIGTTGLLSTGAAARAHVAPPGTATQARGCPSPSDLRALSATGVQHAAGRALAQAPKLYPDLNTTGAEVMAADRSAFAGARGREVSAMCGKKVAARTVVVQMLFPKMLPSASLSQAVVFVGKFAHGYGVWFVAH